MHQEPCTTDGHSPSVWYIAAGYNLPAGIEAYLLHYATELRAQGFDTRILVFEELPKTKHRYLQALEERRIPIESLYAKVRWRSMVLAAMAFVPWTVRRWWRQGAGSRERKTVGGGRTTCHGCLARLHRNYNDLRYTIQKRLAVRRLAAMIERERPDIIHVKGRVITEAWPVFPPERTIYQHTLMGTVDPSWEPVEVEAFSRFANRVARIFVQGQTIATTFAESFGITRPIDVIFSMAPDEAGRRDEGGNLKPEIADCRPQTGDHRLQTIDHRPETGDHRPETPHPASRISHPASPNSNLRFGILCRFTEQKGIRYILEALCLWRDRHGCEAPFIFAGQGPLEPDIREFAQKRRLSEVRIEPVRNLKESLAELDVFVHPGLDDAMPVSIVEALMFGKPCIGTRVGAVPDLIRDGVEGFLIEPASAEAIAAAMGRCAAMTPDEFALFQRCARARYDEACRPEKVGAQVAGHYRSILEENR
jgi:glycosyltransferase involved in cell wall biosynthesis